MLKKQNHSKIIFHIDMNAYFCSVACILNPALRGTAFAIGREGGYKGVISTASYEARKFGIHSAMSLADAFKLKPDLLVINPDYKYYEEYHKKFVNIIKSYTKLIEVASIDEVYADMTEISNSIHPLVLANEIQNRLLKELSLPCSIGIAPTLFLAKMASDMKKPLGITVIRKREVQSILYPLSVKDIYGIGKKTYPKLIDIGIKTIADFMNLNNKSLIINLIGENTYNYAYNSIIGNSSNIVEPNRFADSKSISTSTTFDIFKTSESQILLEIRKMTREVFNKMKADGYLAKTITITLRDSNFDTITRRKTLDDYTDDLYTFYDLANELVEENYDSNKSYRLLGIGLSNLIHYNDLPKEYNLFTISDISQKEERIESLIREYQEKYGKNFIYRKGKK
ncbi:MAG: DNA polymerase IV [Anaeroplasma sp.]